MKGIIFNKERVELFFSNTSVTLSLHLLCGYLIVLFVDFRLAAALPSYSQLGASAELATS